MPKNPVPTTSVSRPFWVPDGSGSVPEGVKHEGMEHEERGRAEGARAVEVGKAGGAVMVGPPLSEFASAEGDAAGGGRTYVRTYVRARSASTLTDALRAGRSGGAALFWRFADCLGKSRK